MTGAGGFVGSWVMAKLMSSGATILAAGLGPENSGADMARSVVLDITQPSAVDQIVADFQPTAVLHLAAISSLTEARRDARRTWDVNLYGTLNVAEAIKRHAPDALLVFAGSSEIYGRTFNTVGGAVDEQGLLSPGNPYAATKAAADLALGQMAEDGLRVIRFRPFNHTGPGQSAAFVVPAFASQIAAIERGERLAVLRVGNLDARRDFLDVRDVVNAYILALGSYSKSNPGVYNLASGVPRRIGDILNDLLAMSSVTIRVELDEGLLRPSDIPLSVGNADRAIAVLGWRPTIAWSTTLRDVLDFQRRQVA